VKVVVTGAAGQLGTELVETFRAAGHEVVGTTHDSLDIVDAESVENLIVDVAPDWIIHGAAWTAVDACESDPDRAFAVNGGGAVNVVEAAKRVGAKVLYVSTDYVSTARKPDRTLNPMFPTRSRCTAPRNWPANAQCEPMTSSCAFHGSVVSTEATW